MGLASVIRVLRPPLRHARYGASQRPMVNMPAGPEISRARQNGRNMRRNVGAVPSKKGEMTHAQAAVGGGFA
jgi:hypothetical protein